MKARLLAFILVFGLIAVAAGWIYESRLRSRADTTELEIPNNIDYFLTNLDFRAMNVDGELDYSFTSPLLEHYRRTDVSHIETPSLRIYRRAGAWLIDARKGEFEHRANLLRLRDSVIMKQTGPDGLELLSQSIRFEPKRNLVTSESSVVLRSRASRIEAQNAIFDLADGIYRLDQARGIYRHDGS